MQTTIFRGSQLGSADRVERIASTAIHNHVRDAGGLPVMSCGGHKTPTDCPLHAVTSATLATMTAARGATVTSSSAQLIRSDERSGVVESDFTGADRQLHRIRQFDAVVWVVAAQGFRFFPIHHDPTSRIDEGQIRPFTRG